MKNFIVCAAALACSQALSLAVVTSPIEAFNNGTINPSGPRTQAAGKTFFNIEGTANGPGGSFASYGVMDFTLASESIPGGEMLSSLNSISISLTQANSTFTASGGLAFYLTTDTTTSIDPGASPLVFNSGQGPEGLGSQLSSTFFLGNDTFTEASSGQVDTYTFDLTELDPIAASYLSGLLQAGGNLRLIIAPTDAPVAATYAGFSNSTASGPVVSVDYSTAPVPEPSTIVLGGLGLAMVLSQRRRLRLA